MNKQPKKNQKESAKKKKKLFYVNVGLYNCGVTVLYGTNKEAEKEYKKTRFYLEHNYEWTSNNRTGGKTIYGEGIDPFLWINSDIEQYQLQGTIAHEVMHVVCAICEYRGIEFRTENDEVLAYLTEWITKQIYFKLGL